MEYVMTLIGWQFVLGFSLCRQKNLKLPTLDELKQMKKEVYRRFRQRVKRS